jgi:hypothetical protein
MKFVPGSWFVPFLVSNPSRLNDILRVLIRVTAGMRMSTRSKENWILHISNADRILSIWVRRGHGNIKLALRQ